MQTAIPDLIICILPMKGALILQMVSIAPNSNIIGVSSTDFFTTPMNGLSNLLSFTAFIFEAIQLSNYSIRNYDNNFMIFKMLFTNGFNQI